MEIAIAQMTAAARMSNLLTPETYRRAALRRRFVDIREIFGIILKWRSNEAQNQRN